jgi:hypothetical protein
MEASVGDKKSFFNDFNLLHRAGDRQMLMAHVHTIWATAEKNVAGCGCEAVE